MNAQPPKFAFMHYSSTTRTQPPQNLDQVPLAWRLETPGLDELPENVQDRFKPWATEAAAVLKAVRGLETLLVPKNKKLITAITELRESETATPQARKVAIYALGALDDVSRLLD